MNSNHPGGRAPPAKILRLLMEHQRWINTAGRYGLKLDKDELQLTDLNLDGVDFSGAELRYAVFHGGSVRGARFTGTNLQYAIFRSCDVEAADFSRAELSGAAFITNHEKASFDGANITNTAWNAEEMKRDAALRSQQRDARFTAVSKFLGTLNKGPR